MTGINSITIKTGEKLSVFSEGGDLKINQGAPNMAVLSVGDVTPPPPVPGERNAVLSYRQVAHFDRWDEVEFSIDVLDVGSGEGIYRIPAIEYVPDTDPRKQLWQKFTHEFGIPEGVRMLEVQITCRMPSGGRTGTKIAEFSLLVDGVEVIQNPNFRGTGNWRVGEDAEFYFWTHMLAFPNVATQGNGNGRPQSNTDPGGSGRFKAQENDPIAAFDGPIQYGEWAGVVQIIDLGA